MNKKNVKKNMIKVAKKVVKKNNEVKKVEVVIVKQKSISQLVFKFINDNNLLESDNRKAKYLELEEMVKKEFPNSAFKKTHFFWYISRAAKQKALNLGMTHLITIPKKDEEKK